jgi:hypothetical protein
VLGSPDTGLAPGSLVDGDGNSLHHVRISRAGMVCRFWPARLQFHGVPETGDYLHIGRGWLIRAGT